MARMHGATFGNFLSKLFFSFLFRKIVNRTQWIFGVTEVSVASRRFYFIYCWQFLCFCFLKGCCDSHNFCRWSMWRGMHINMNSFDVKHHPTSAMLLACMCRQQHNLCIDWFSACVWHGGHAFLYGFSALVFWRKRLINQSFGIRILPRSFTRHPNTHTDTSDLRRDNNV